VTEGPSPGEEDKDTIMPFQWNSWMIARNKEVHSFGTVQRLYCHWTGIQCLPLLLDLSVAFDTVNHSLLLSRLENSFGITGTVLQWIHSYLSGRSQLVEINDTKSSVRDLTVFRRALS